MRSWLAAAALICAAAASVPEPSGYWTGPAQAPVPSTLSGGSLIHTGDLAALLKTPGVVLIDVANAVHRPAGLPPTSLWLLPPHRDIPGSVWIPGVGNGTLQTSVDEEYRAKLQALTGGDTGRPIVIYCHHACWLSWNAAKRAISYGYSHVIWYPDGVEGWTEAGQKLDVVKTAAP